MPTILVAAAGRSNLRRLVTVVIAGTVAGCTPPQDAATSAKINWLLGPAPEQDLIRAEASEASLRTKFGDANVRQDSIELGEGERALGTALFPDDSTRRLEIIWTDTARRARPMVVYVRGRSEWRMYPGPKLGYDLKFLETLNEKPFTLYGFGWDYGGTVASFNGGRLDSLWLPQNHRLVLARLGPDRPRENPFYGEVLGEREYSSSVRGMQSLNPTIYEILFFPR